MTLNAILAAADCGGSPTWPDVVMIGLFIAGFVAVLWAMLR